MKDAENEEGRKSFMGKFFSPFRKKKSGDAGAPTEPAVPEPVPEPSAEELAAIEAERERIAQEQIKRERDSMARAASSSLYKLYQSHHGLPPVTDDNGCYSLSVFTEHNELPTDEERALLIWLDQRLASAGKGSPGGVAPARKAAAAASGSGAPESEPGRVDADCRVLMPENALNAYIFVLPPQNGGGGFTNEDVRHALFSANVSFGLIDARVEAVVAEQRYLTITNIASGIAPKDGKDGRVVDRFLREARIKLKERADGTIDYRDLGWLQTTARGDAISEIIPPLPPTDGKNVRGETVPGNTGKPAMPPIGVGVALSEDGSRLLATIDGVVLFKQDRFLVEPLLTIESDVDSAVGNLDLIGSAIIKGDIRGGYSIKATGNITVQGRVENAFVKAGGSIQVGNGMNGGDTGTLRAEGDIVCRYIEHSTVSAGNNVVSDTIVNSNVSAGNYVEVTTGRGTVVGGCVVARNRVQALTVGNYGNTLTSIVLGDTMESLEEKQALSQKSAALGKELSEREKSLKHLGQRPVMGPLDRKRAEELKKTIMSLTSALQEAKARLDEIERSRPPNTGCYLRAGVVHPPLELTISGVRTTVRTGTSGARFVKRSGEVVQAAF